MHKAYKTLKALQRLTEADQFKDNFVATVAHELRNPLGPISGAAYVLSNGPFEDRVRQTAVLIERQIKQMTRLVDDLLDVSRVRLGLLAINPVVVRLSDIVRSALEASHLSAEPSSRSVCLQIADEDISLLGNRHREGSP